MLTGVIRFVEFLVYTLGASSDSPSAPFERAIFATRVVQLTYKDAPHILHGLQRRCTDWYPQLNSVPTIPPAAMPIIFGLSLFSIRVERGTILFDGTTVEDLEHAAFVWWNEDTLLLRLPYVVLRVIYRTQAPTFLTTDLLGSLRSTHSSNDFETLAMEMLSLRLQTFRFLYPGQADISVGQLFQCPSLEDVAVRIPLPDPSFPHQVTKTPVQYSAANWHTLPPGFYTFAKGGRFPDGAYKPHPDSKVCGMFVQMKQRVTQRKRELESKEDGEQRRHSPFRTRAGKKVPKPPPPVPLCRSNVAEEYQKLSPSSPVWNGDLVFVMVSEAEYSDGQPNTPAVWTENNGQHTLIVFDWASGNYFFGRLVDTLKLLRAEE